ncbi:MAG: diacylglycerol/lipid kinase family protein [Flavisolibacter sp.]
MKKLLYLVNPVSGTKDKKTVRMIIESETQRAGFEYAIYPSVESGDYSFLLKLIKEENFTDIIIAGGDGTVNQAVNSLRPLRIPFGIIPVGSGNGLAFSAGIPKEPAKALDVIFTGKPQWTDGFMVNDTFACMLCGLGLDAQVAHDFANHPRRGLATYIRKTVSNFFTASAYPFVVTTSGKKISTDAFFISIANSNQFGNNFTIAPAASLNDGVLDIVVMTKQNKFSVLLQALNQVTGYHKPKQFEYMDEKAEVLYFQTDELSISNPGQAPMHIDGDPVETEKDLSIRIQKNCFRLIYPAYSAAREHG